MPGSGMRIVYYLRFIACQLSLSPAKRQVGVAGDFRMVVESACQNARLGWQAGKIKVRKLSKKFGWLYFLFDLPTSEAARPNASN